MQVQFRLSTLIAWTTFVAMALVVARVGVEFPESRLPLIAINGFILLTLLGIGSTRVVCWCAVIGWLLSAMAFACVNYFKPFHPKDAEFYIMAYSALVSAASALTGLIATALLAARDAIRKRTRRV